MLRVKLHPFDQLLRPYEFHGEIAIFSQNLVFKYEISGDYQELKLPATSQEPKRLDFLWQHTCFEAFFAPPKGSAYWELNLSPSGDWNFYHFFDYRKKSPHQPSLNFHYETSRTSTKYQACATLEGSFFDEPILLMGLTAVLQTHDSKSYWALSHPKSEPDFHDSRNFRIKTDFSTLELLMGECDASGN